MSIVCRICGTEIPIDQNLCPNCGRLKVNFPAILPDKLKKLFDEEKVRYDQDVKDGDEKVSFSAATEESLKKEISEQIQKLEALEKEKKDAEAEAESRANELSNQLLEATKRADAAEERIAENTKVIQGIQMEKNELLEQIKAHDVERPIAFLVQMQGDDISAIYDIYEGENSFGYMRPHDRHQQIICTAHVADDHFVIKSTTTMDSKGRPRTKYHVAPKDGKIYRSANHSNIIDSEVEFEKNESIFVDDVKFTLVANKK